MRTLHFPLALLLAIPLLMLAAAPVNCQSLGSGWRGHVAAGATYPVGDRWSGAATIGAERGWRPFVGGLLTLDVSAIGIRGRQGTRPQLSNDTQALAVGMRWRRAGWILGFSPALATARTDTISGTLQFLTTAGYQWQCCALLLQHMSNAGIRGRNIGETMLVVEWGFGRS
jgi:hypothetical protein